MTRNVDIVVMGNQATTTFVNLDDPAREITSRAPGASPKKPASPDPQIKRRPGRPKKEQNPNG